jgi:precorrin-6B C5,15-methyltransferase / cobalt-precorrin-6B C5,C15-methyltransferase
MTPWLSIIGIGEDGWTGLAPKALQTIEAAHHIIGSTRTLAMLPSTRATKHEWPQPFSAVVDQLKPLRGQATVMLATGDPMNYGVARKILGFIPKSEVSITPHVSAFSLAASRMGWSLPDCDCFTIHGRPAANVEAFIQPDAHLLILTQDETSVSEVCRRLIARGFETSDVTVLENMGGPKERLTTFTANARPDLKWSPLNSLAIHCKASPQAKIWSRVAGLPDDVFAHDGKITKREVRAATLAALGPCPDQVLWDVGAGSGSIGIEWMRSTRGCEAYAIEPLADRRVMIATNADQLGTPRLHIIPKAAPEAYAGLPRPHAVFIGGGISVAGTFEGAWEALLSGGTMVANVVTIEGEMHLYDLQDKYGGELVRMETSILTKVGPHRALKPRMAVTQWRVKKS